MEDPYENEGDTQESSQYSQSPPTPPYSNTQSETPSQVISPSPSSELLEIDKELESLLQKQNAKIKVVGIGGGGNNTLSRIHEIGVRGGEMVAMNTDAQDLLYANSDKKILLGRELTKGLGAGSNPQIGEESARESEAEIKKKLEGADMIFITCGLGGGTGTGAAPIVADVAKKLGALVIGIVTMPFTIEGAKRVENANLGLEKMESIVDTLIVIPNDKLLEIVPDLPLQTAFKVADEILTNAVKGTAELVTKAGLVNLDFADVKTIMSNGGVSLIGVGESDSENRAKEAVEKAINNPLLDVDVSNARGALVNIIGGPDLSLDESKIVIEEIGNHLSDNARLIWGAQISPDMEKTMRVMLIITGVKSPQISGYSETMPMDERLKGELSSELGIEFLK
ncbi:cell division protein FtsZ [Candidatus Pacearchaeota archaeon]|nr:cell division protein FtsZ [Candidatus Pacearchaeota archaeon]